MLTERTRELRYLLMRQGGDDTSVLASIPPLAGLFYFTGPGCFSRVKYFRDSVKDY